MYDDIGRTQSCVRLEECLAMFTGRRIGWAGLAIGALLISGAGVGTLVRAGNITGNIDQVQQQKEKKLTQGEKEAKKLLLLMDKDQNGMVSKAEFMAFMDAEFDRLDKDHNGELNVQELTQVPIHSSGAVHR